MHSTSSPVETWLGDKSYCVSNDVAALAEFVSDGHTSIAFGNLSSSRGDDDYVCDTIASQYLGAFTMGMMFVTGTGGTDSYPSKGRTMETIVMLFLVLLGCFLWTQILAMFCDVATNGNPDETVYQQTLDVRSSLIEQQTTALVVFWGACR